jgi:3-methyladenine DNA glycosylase/8-oxoguanine DNA glycosylase
VRAGIASHFGLGASGAGKRGALHEAKDKGRMEACLAPFRPYRSLAAWYMWRANETAPSTITPRTRTERAP